MAAIVSMIIYKKKNSDMLKATKCLTSQKKLFRNDHKKRDAQIKTATRRSKMMPMQCNARFPSLPTSQSVSAAAYKIME